MARAQWRKASNERRGVNPTLIFFLLGVALFFVGASLPSLWFLALAGGFIVLTYIITMIVWVIAHAT